MTLRLIAASFGIAVVIGLPGAAPAQEKTGSDPAGRDGDTVSARSKTETATIGGGCFWSIEAVFERIPGVKSVVSGFSEGNVPNPSYDMVCTGTTGHAEVVHVEFDPKVVPYETLLRYYWKAHDPTTVNSQGDDFGPQYRSVIFYHSEDQKKTAQKVYQELTSKRVFRAPIVTQLFPFTSFYPAEPYHQDYYRNHRGNTYCDFYVEPKLKKLHLTGKTSKSAR